MKWTNEPKTKSQTSATEKFVVMIAEAENLIAELEVALGEAVSTTRNDTFSGYSVAQ